MASLYCVQKICEASVQSLYLQNYIQYISLSDEEKYHGRDLNCTPSAFSPTAATSQSIIPQPLRNVVIQKKRDDKPNMASRIAPREAV
jgi:hypothetical protein